MEHLISFNKSLSTVVLMYELFCWIASKNIIPKYIFATPQSRIWHVLGQFLDPVAHT